MYTVSYLYNAEQSILVWAMVEVCSLLSILSFTQTGVNGSGRGIVTLYAAPNPFLLNQICLHQWLILEKEKFLKEGKLW